MPFNLATLYGASIVNFSCQIGWGANQVSQCSINLVEDTRNGDVFAAPAIYTPTHFNYYGFNFTGLLQKWTKKKDRSGLPTYEVTLHDPRELLDGAQLILGDYNGSISITNLINVYGFWENTTGFGTSLANDAGMPWNMIVNALLAICNQPVQTLYGGPITKTGFKFGLDLSQLPIVPNDYRIGGTHASILDCIAQVCDDSGYDFFVELDGLKIKVRTQSRRSAPPFGTITALSNAGLGTTLVRSEAGLEARNDSSATTSVMLIGGPVQTLYSDGTITSFWGFDINGAPILGIPGIYSSTDINGNISDFAADFMTLNCSPVADILGTTSYPTNTIELRLALHNRSIWEMYIQKERADVDAILGAGFAAFLRDPLVGVGQLMVDIVNDGAQRAVQAAQNRVALQANQANKRERFYNFIRKTAETYYGKKWAVGIPFVSRKIDSQTGAVQYSLEPTDGGYLDEGATPLGLPTQFNDIFTLQDGRFTAFAFSGSNLDVDFTRLSPSDTVVTEGVGVFNVYSRVSVDPNIIFTPNPIVVVTTSTPLYKTPEDIKGGWGLLDAVAVKEQNAMIRMERNAAGGTLPIGTAQEVIQPDYIVLPLKSNILTYGPWSYTMTPGRTRIEQDQSLVPWNYGGYTGLNAVAQARISQAISLVDIYETGMLELTGTPSFSLGDALQTGCPNITGMDVQIGEQGVKTTYHFKTYTPRFGVFTRDKAEKIRKNAVAQQNFRKSVKALNKFAGDRQNAVNDAFRGMIANRPPLERGESPHPVFIARSINRSDGSGLLQPVSACTNEESIAFSNADNDAEYQNTAIMSFDGMFRPIKSNLNGTPSGTMSAYKYPSGDSALNSSVLHPFDSDSSIGQTSTTFLSTGTTYTRLKPKIMDYLGSNVEKRFIGLRAPIVLTGFGYDTHGNPTPNSGTGFYPNMMNRPDLWKSGPVDFLWSEERGCWTPHGFVKGILQGTLNAYDESIGVDLSIYGTGVNQPCGWNLKVYDWLGFTGSSGMKAIAHYSPEANKWYASPLPSGSSAGSSSVFSGAKVETNTAYQNLKPPYDGGLDNITVLFQVDSIDTDNYYDAGFQDRLTVQSYGHYEVGYNLYLISHENNGIVSPSGYIDIINSYVVLNSGDILGGVTSPSIHFGNVLSSGAFLGLSQIHTHSSIHLLNSGDFITVVCGTSVEDELLTPTIATSPSTNLWITKLD